ncbi:MAG: histidine ammonia-lyase [Chloroherpetonaceae bacterium]
MASAHLALDGETLSLERIKSAQSISISASARKKILASRRVVDRLTQSDKAHYGINTGFGILAREKVEPHDLEKLQENLILSHAVGVGDFVPERIVRLMMLLKVNALAKGYSGISLEATQRLCDFFNHHLSPLVYTQGSVGASGDLAPLAHLVLAMMGEGDVLLCGKQMPAKKALKQCRFAPYKLKSKEGLALINGTQFMLAYAVDALLRAEVIVITADLCAAITLEAMRGSSSPFDARIHALRPQQGQIIVAENIRRCIAGSEIMQSHKDCQKVQDPYSLRCAPQVHGACRDAMLYARRVVEIELNSATDNPLVFENGDVISGGNFHGEPLALALDTLAIALAELASISERRIYLLLGGDSVGGIDLPKLLMRDTGLNSGFMLPQYTAAALVSENKILAHPAAVDSIPTSLGQEDHVSMGSISATKLHKVVQNVETVLAIELMCAAQALDFLRPLKSGKAVEIAHEEIRKVVSHADSDRLFHNDIEAVLRLVQSETIVRAVSQAVGKLK